MNPYLICDLGSCHNHDAPLTKDFIQELAGIGVQAIKMQFWSDPLAFAEARHHPELESPYTKWATRFDFLQEVQAITKGEGLDFMCSVFLEKDVKVLAPLVDYFKIASLEAKDRNLLFAVDQYSSGKDIFIATGCSDQNDMQYFNQLRDNRLTTKLHSMVRVLHCISSYPAKPEEMNLKSLQSNRLDGLSDHSCNPIAGVVAVCFGAVLFEFHGRHGATPQDCPDFGHSMDINGIENYMDAITTAQSMFGESLRCVTPGEEPLLSFRRET